MSIDDSSSSDDDLNSFNIWSKKRKTSKSSNSNEGSSQNFNPVKLSSENSLSHKNEKFESLKRIADDIRLKSSLQRLRYEQRRSRKLIKKALKDPNVKSLVEQNETLSSIDNEENKEEWKDIKPFLTINDHIQGPISHGPYGPKTELENIVDDAIKEGDFEKAELISDTLANREFAVKISQAFAAKRYHERREKEETERKAKQKKKIQWTFEAKERWQMKGNM